MWNYYLLSVLPQDCWLHLGRNSRKAFWAEEEKNIFSYPRFRDWFGFVAVGGLRKGRAVGCEAGRVDAGASSCRGSSPVLQR